MVVAAHEIRTAQTLTPRVVRPGWKSGWAGLGRGRLSSRCCWETCWANKSGLILPALLPGVMAKLIIAAAAAVGAGAVVMKRGVLMRELVVVLCCTCESLWQ